GSAWSTLRNAGGRRSAPLRGRAALRGARDVARHIAHGSYRNATYSKLAGARQPRRARWARGVRGIARRAGGYTPRAARAGAASGEPRLRRALPLRAPLSALLRAVRRIRERFSGRALGRFRGLAPEERS